MELGFVLAHGRTDVDRPIMWQPKGNARRYQRGHRLGRVLVIGVGIRIFRLHVALASLRIQVSFVEIHAGLMIAEECATLLLTLVLFLRAVPNSSKVAQVS